MKDWIAGLLRYEKWSPELISNRLELEVRPVLATRQFINDVYGMLRKSKKSR
jgi:hypothetical protein